MDISRRTVLKGVGATPAGVVAASTVTLNSADAAAKITQIGTVWVPKLWGMKTVRQRIPGTRRYQSVKVQNTRKLLRTSVSSKANVTALLKKGLWFYPGADVAGSEGHVKIFGHRTHDGGPMRNSHKLRGEVEDLCALYNPAALANPADVVYVNGFEYIIEQVKVWPIYTPKNQSLEERQKAQDSIDAIFTYPPELPGATGGRVSLIGCSKPNGLPTSGKNRIVVRARLNTTPPTPPV